MAPEANRFKSFLRILKNAISSGENKNKQTKQPQKLVCKFIEKKKRKYMKLKYLDQLRKKTSVVS